MWLLRTILLSQSERKAETGTELQIKSDKKDTA
jgi:hypothetical protein